MSPITQRETFPRKSKQRCVWSDLPSACKPACDAAPLSSKPICSAAARFRNETYPPQQWHFCCADLHGWRESKGTHVLACKNQSSNFSQSRVVWSHCVNGMQETLCSIVLIPHPESSGSFDSFCGLVLRSRKSVELYRFNLGQLLEAQGFGLLAPIISQSSGLALGVLVSHSSGNTTESPRNIQPCS